MRPPLQNVQHGSMERHCSCSARVSGCDRDCLKQVRATHQYWCAAHCTMTAGQCVYFTVEQQCATLCKPGPYVAAHARDASQDGLHRRSCVADAEVPRLGSVAVLACAGIRLYVTKI